MIKLGLEWREVLWWLRGGMTGSHLRWSVYKDMVNKVWPQCTEQERRNIHYIMERDFGEYWRNSDGDWKPESEISDKTPYMYFRQVLARFDPENQYAVTLRVRNEHMYQCLKNVTKPAIIISLPKPPLVKKGETWTSLTATAVSRAYKWDGRYMVDWSCRCDESLITKVEKLTIPDDGTM